MFTVFIIFMKTRNRQGALTTMDKKDLQKGISLQGQDEFTSEDSRTVGQAFQAAPQNLSYY